MADDFWMICSGFEGWMTFVFARGSRSAATISVLLIGLAVPPVAAQQVLPLATQATPTEQARAFATAIAEAAAEDEAIAGFYRDRGYAAFWTGPADSERRSALLQALAGAGAHGLPTLRYDPADLIASVRAARTEGDRGRVEVAMTRALLDYARDVQTGALVPSKVNAAIKREVPVRDRRANLDAFAKAASPAAFLGALPPASQEYAQLVKARFALQHAVETGGWGPEIPAARVEPGATGPALIALRDRLVAQGYLAPNAIGTYDARIGRAVRIFQADHGLNADGVAGESTVRELNVGPETRLRAVLVALERERWSNIDRGRRHIWVNLADFSAKIIDDGRVTFSTRTVVGETQADKSTPEFSHMMTYMELNPDWTVPPGIIRRDYLPRLQANPHALGHLTITDRRGRVVQRGSVDFSAYSASNFPFSIRQSPGDGNALGKVKFMFPNPWAIYLHDTPHKELFARETRAFSNGCVRLADPFDFAYELLSRQEADPKKAFHDVLDTGRQERVTLKDPVPVHLEYRTAFTNPKGRMQYRRDIYGRDAQIHAALIKAGVAGTGEEG
jgi:murein L,D-transpeptidase YcbB/YkuD